MTFKPSRTHQHPTPHISDEEWEHYKKQANKLDKIRRKNTYSRRKRLKASPATPTMSLSEEWRKENNIHNTPKRKTESSAQKPSAQDLDPYDMAGMDEMRTITTGGGRKRTLEWNNKIALHNKEKFLEDSKRLNFFDDGSHH